MKTIIGHSDEVDSSEAAAAVIARCEADLAGEEPVGGLLFASVDYDHQTLLGAFRERWPGLPLIGGSTDGELSSAGGFQYDSVLLTLFTGQGLRARAEVARDLSRGIDGSLSRALEELPSGDLCIAMPHPGVANTSELLRGLEARLGSDCPIVGGFAGDHRGENRFAEFYGGEILEDACPLLVLEGGLKTSFGVGSGWFPFGDPARVTKSEGNVVRSIGGRRALDVYASHYGTDEFSVLGEHPLAVYADEDWGASKFVLRAVLEVRAEEGALVFSGDVPEGSHVRLTEVLPEGILEGSRRSLESALQTYPGSAPSSALVFTCAARKWILGTRVEDEISELRSALGEARFADLQMAGFYGYGELAPEIGGSRTQLHNETCVSVVLGR